MSLIAFLLKFATAAALQTAPPADCQAALGPLFQGTEESALPNQVDGAALRGGDALVALRAARGDAVITVKGGNFARADFRGARLHNICFLDTDLSGSDWRDARAPGTGFVRVNLSGADLRGAHFERVLLRNANLENANGEGAVLASGRLDGGWNDGSITRLNLDRADLTRFRFDCGILLEDGCPIDSGDPRISLRGAILTEANLFGYQSLEGARIDRTEVELHELRDLAAADIAGPIRLRGGDAIVELSRAEFDALLPRVGLVDEAVTPSFDCDGARTAAERFICGDQGARIRQLDRDVAALYREAVARNPNEARVQVRWLRERDRCFDPGAAYGCIDEAYERRKAMLAGRVAPPSWLRPGAYSLFVSLPVSFDPAFLADPLFNRLVPVLIGGAWSRLAVRVNADGSLDAAGDALGANGHDCWLGASALRLDAASGWYSVSPASGRTRPAPVLQLRGDWAEVYALGHADRSHDPLGEAASEYASCGMRAAFYDMLRMPDSQDEARRALEEVDEPR